MWISPQDQVLQAQCVALIAMMMSLFGFMVKRNQLWFSFLSLSITAVLVAAVIIADLGT